MRGLNNDKTQQVLSRPECVALGACNSLCNKWTSCCNEWDAVSQIHPLDCLYARYTYI